MNSQAYRDSDGEACSLDILCRREPAWAANRIRELEAEIKNLKYDLTSYMEIANSELNRAEAAEAEVKRLRIDLSNRITISVEAINRADVAEMEVRRLKQQLPQEMQHCTIRFNKCSVGHGRLTADNWIDHGCQSCRAEAAEAKLRAVEGLPEKWLGQINASAFGGVRYAGNWLRKYADELEARLHGEQP